MAKTWKNKNKLTQKEQRTTAAFKLITEEKKTLEKSLRLSQDQLEEYRSKYHAADKNHALEKNKNNTLALHEILKFVISAVCGGIGVNLITDKNFLQGILVLVIGIVLYAIIVRFDRK